MFLFVSVIVGVSVGRLAGAHLLLTDEGQIHAAGSVVPALRRHSLQHLGFHDVTTVLVPVVVGLVRLPETTVREERPSAKKMLCFLKICCAQ